MRQLRKFLCRIWRRIKKPAPVRHPWLGHLFLILVGFFAFLVALVPDCHRLVCQKHAGNMEYVFEKGVAVLSGVTKVTVSTSIMEPGKMIWWKYAHLQFKERIEKLESGDLLLEPIQNLDSLAHIWFVWYQKYDVVFVSYLDRCHFHNNGMIDTTRVESDGYLPGYAAYFYQSKKADENFDGLCYLLGEFAEINRQVYPGMSADTLYHQAVERVIYHSQHLSQNLANRLRIAAGWIIVLIELWIGIHFARRRRLNFLRAYSWYQDSIQRGYLVSRPSRISCLFSRNVAQYLTDYQRQLQKEEHNHRQQLKLAKQKEEEERQLASRTMVFEEQLLELKLILEQISDIPAEIADYWKKVNDSQLPLRKREQALWGIHQWIIENAAVDETDDEPEKKTTFEDQLWEQVKEIKVTDLTDDKQREFHEFVQLAQKEPRYRKRIYYLERALNVVFSVSEIESEVEAVETAGPAVETTLSGGNEIIDQTDLVAMLDIRQHIPRQIDFEHAVAIILWGLLRPGQRGRSLFLSRYITSQYVYRDVASKMKKQFDPKLYENALSWLIRNGVVLIPKPTRQTVYSLNPHPSDATEAGRLIVECILSFQYEVTQLTT